MIPLAVRRDKEAEARIPLREEGVEPEGQKTLGQPVDDGAAGLAFQPVGVFARLAAVAALDLEFALLRVHEGKIRHLIHERRMPDRDRADHVGWIGNPGLVTGPDAVEPLPLGHAYIGEQRPVLDGRIIDLLGNDAPCPFFAAPAPRRNSSPPPTPAKRWRRRRRSAGVSAGRPFHRRRIKAANRIRLSLQQVQDADFVLGGARCEARPVIGLESIAARRLGVPVEAAVAVVGPEAPGPAHRGTALDDGVERRVDLGVSTKPNSPATSAFLELGIGQASAALASAAAARATAARIAIVAALFGMALVRGRRRCGRCRHGARRERCGIGHRSGGGHTLGNGGCGRRFRRRGDGLPGAVQLEDFSSTLVTILSYSSLSSKKSETYKKASRPVRYRRMPTACPATPW